MPTDEDPMDLPPSTEEVEKVLEEEGVDPEEVGRFRRFARRLMDRRELAEDTRDLLAAVLSTSDRAKSEIVRMTGREVRHYLDGLRLKEDLLEVATNYKLEVHATFHLAPIAEALKDGDAKDASKTGSKTPSKTDAAKSGTAKAEPAKKPEREAGDDEG